MNPDQPIDGSSASPTASDADQAELLDDESSDASMQASEVPATTDPDAVQEDGVTHEVDDDEHDELDAMQEGGTIEQPSVASPS